MRYYSQFGEDVALEPLLKDVVDGFYVDIGAHDGVTDSNTKYFEEKYGFTGICVEPHSVYYQRLKVNRPKAKCLNYAVWDKSGETVDFHETSPGGWSRVGGGGEFSTVKISHPETKTLNDILCEYDVCSKIDLMSVDVEGHERHVFDGFTLEDYNPRIVIVEDLSHKGQYDDCFKEYYPVYGWKQGKRGSNVIYCREQSDYVIARERYRG